MRGKGYFLEMPYIVVQRSVFFKEMQAIGIDIFIHGLYLYR